MLAQLMIPNAFAEEIFAAAEDAVRDMSEFAFGYALDTLPSGFAGAARHGGEQASGDPGHARQRRGSHSTGE